MLERKMWDAYAKQAGGVTFDGKPLPTWDELGEDRQACWKAAASVCKDEIERLRKTLRQIIELNPFNSNTGNASIQYVTQMLVKMTALAHEALKEKE